MPDLDLFKLLSYGAIGLGCILAVLAYLLISAEQKRAAPRRRLLSSIYVFMAFSLALTTLGFGAELWKESLDQNAKAQTDKLADEIASLQKQIAWLQGHNDKQTKAAANLKDANAQLSQQLDTTRIDLATVDTKLEDLGDLKQGNVTQTSHRNATSPGDSTRVTQIGKDLSPPDTRSGSATNGHAK
jgi:hypothetical protein